MNVEETYRQFTDGNTSGAVRADWVERYLDLPSRSGAIYTLLTTLGTR